MPGAAPSAHRARWRWLLRPGAQAQVLRNEGCGYLQGFLFAKPRRFTDIVSDLAVQRLRETRHGRQEDHYLKELASRNALQAR